MEKPNTAENPTADTKTEQPIVNVEAERASAAAEAKAAERARIGAILGCDEAQGREALARTIALETDSDAGAARKLLAAAPKAAPAAQNPLAAAMAGLPNPNVGTGTSAGSGEEDVSAAVRQTVALYQGKEVK